MSVFFRLYLGLLILAPALTQAATLEIPGTGSNLSGIGVISGWKCEATAITVVIDDGTPIPMLHGSELVAAQHGIEIRFTGWQLSQSDLDVWEQVLHLARTQALGTECYFTAHGFLKALGRATGKQNHEWLKSVFSRLSATDVQIRHKGRTYFGSLIEGGIRDEDTGRYVVEINPKLAKFYGRSQWTQIDWEQRQQLRGKPLALWLHGFYASHAAPYPLTVVYLHKLSGSQTKQLRKFKQNLTQALEELVGVGAIKSFEIRDELVHVRTVPSQSQQKHLATRRPPDRQRK